MMLDNSSYNKIKMLYKLSEVCWFIEKHAIMDAQQAGDVECMEAMKEIQFDLQKHIDKLQRKVCSVTQ